jgi:hypothetical protein
MAFFPLGLSRKSEARRSEEWYADSLGDTPLQRGDRMFRRGEGGPRVSRLKVFRRGSRFLRSAGFMSLSTTARLERGCNQFVATIDR